MNINILTYVHYEKIDDYKVLDSNCQWNSLWKYHKGAISVIFWRYKNSKHVSQAT